MSIINLTLPLRNQDVRQLKRGDIVALTGTIFTARDAVHKYLYEDGESPVDFSGSAIYHCGPVTVKDSNGQWKITAAGPTTSIREEPYMAKVIGEHGVKAVIGKGGMGKKTAKACIEHGCVYLTAYGGCAQLLADKIVRVKNVYFYDEFGAPEAIWELEVNSFPAVVTIDSHGGNLHSEIELDSKEQVQKLIQTYRFTNSEPTVMKKTHKKIHSNTLIENAAVKIVQTLKKANHQAFFVGGCVRDALLGIPAKDIDIATSAKPEEVVKLFKRTIPVGAAFGVITVVVDDLNFEVATFRAEADYVDGRHPETVKFANAEADAVRRDFTINTLFYDPEEETIIDFTEGIEDLNKQILKTVGDPEERFSEDYLRMLRAVRFSARLDFMADPDMMKAISNHAKKITKISVERIFNELTNMITGANPVKAMDMLLQTGLLQHILPEVVKFKGCVQPEQFHPEGDVWNHTMLALSNMKASPSPALAWSVLLHDIGKPATLEFKEDGTPTTKRHASVGSRIATKILRRFKASNKLIEIVESAVNNHMKFINVQDMRPAKLRRFLSTEHFPLELELHRLDCKSASGNLENYYFVCKQLKDLEESGGTQLPPPLITGSDLIKIGHKPSPLFSKILLEIQERQLCGELTNTKDAFRWIKENF